MWNATKILFFGFFVVVFFKNQHEHLYKSRGFGSFLVWSIQVYANTISLFPSKYTPRSGNAMLSGTVIKTKKQTNKTGATSQTLRGSVQMLKSMTIRTVRKRLITMGCLEGLTGRSTFSLKKHGSTAYSIPSYWKLESCSHWFKYEPLCIPECSRAKCEAICPTQSLAIICLFLIKKKCNSCKIKFLILPVFLLVVFCFQVSERLLIIGLFWLEIS